MYAIVIEDRFFNCGRSFNQLIGIESELNEALKLTEEFVKKNPQFKHHSIIVEEIFIDHVSRVGLKPIRG